MDDDGAHEDNDVDDKEDDVDDKDDDDDDDDDYDGWQGKLPRWWSNLYSAAPAASIKVRVSTFIRIIGTNWKNYHLSFIL